MTAPASMGRPRLLVAAALALFLGGHVFWLAPSLEDVDSVNFALGVRQYDIARHQPHPPGYPLFIGLAKLSSAAVLVLTRADAPSTFLEARGISVWGAVFGALSALPLFVFFRALDGHGWRAALAVALTLANPLMWFNASRPLSDVPGLCVTLLAQALLAMAFARQLEATRVPAGAEIDRAALLASGRLFVLGAFVAGLAIGLRSQSAWLTTPLILLVLFDRVGRDVAGALIGGTVTYAIGVALWLVPLLVLTGGPMGYVSAISAQAGEDLAGVDLLATNLKIRLLVVALVHTFAYPWVSTPLAAAALAAAAVGTVVLALRDRRALLVVLVVVGPYLLFHLGFQESFTTRYALPFVPVVAWLAVRGLFAFGITVATVASAGLAAVSLAVAVPAVTAYASEASPLFRAIADVRGARAALDARGEVPPIAMHHAVARSARIDPLAANAFPSPSGREWSPIADYWLQGGTSPVWFLVEPRRTDLARFDPSSVRVRMGYRWPVDEATFVGGARPMTVDWVELGRPGWFLTDGWALTPEMAGQAARERRGPSLGGLTAWIRRRPAATTLLVGGRNLGARDEPEVAFTLAIDGVTLQRWTAVPAPGFFLHVWPVPAGALAGEGSFAKLTITAEAADGSARPVRAAIEQFDLQGLDAIVSGFGDGWHEMEYRPSTGVTWRWTSERSALRVVAPEGQPVHLTLRGESPLRYFDQAPKVRVLAGGSLLREFEPRDDFTERIAVPADALRASGGTILIETDRTWVPGDRTGGGDLRHLGLRIFDAKVSGWR